MSKPSESAPLALSSLLGLSANLCVCARGNLGLRYARSRCASAPSGDGGSGVLVVTASDSVCGGDNPVDVAYVSTPNLFYYYCHGPGGVRCIGKSTNVYLLLQNSAPALTLSFLHFLPLMNFYSRINLANEAQPFCAEPAVFNFDLPQRIYCGSINC